MRLSGGVFGEEEMLDFAAESGRLGMWRSSFHDVEGCLNDLGVGAANEESCSGRACELACESEIELEEAVGDLAAPVTACLVRRYEPEFFP